MLKNNDNELDYLILACIVNSDESDKDILSMTTRFISLRFQSQVLNSKNKELK